MSLISSLQGSYGILGKIYLQINAQSSQIDEVLVDVNGLITDNQVVVSTANYNDDATRTSAEARAYAEKLKVSALAIKNHLAAIKTALETV